MRVCKKNTCLLNKTGCRFAYSLKPVMQQLFLEENVVEIVCKFLRKKKEMA